MNLHKDKFISPTIYQELRGLEVKRNGKVEHSDLTHDDQIFSYLMALYVWYNGKNLRETFGIEKNAIQTEDSIDDIVELEGSKESANMIPSIANANRLETSEMSNIERAIAEIKKNQGILLSEFKNRELKHDEERLKILLMNPIARKAYADKYKISVDAVSFDDGTSYDDPQNSMGLPPSLFNDFYKSDDELDSSSIYNSISAMDLSREQMYRQTYEDDSLH